MSKEGDVTLWVPITEFPKSDLAANGACYNNIIGFPLETHKDMVIV